MGSAILPEGVFCIVLYIETGRADAAFNFAFEEYCIAHLANGRKIIAIWQAENCVMLGRYQLAQREINEIYRQRLCPQIVRRASGGGAIYTDGGTLLFSVIMPVQEGAMIDFSKICAPFVQALNEMGIPATLGGRNDIWLEGKKISGSAQTVKKGYLCAHGSLLYDTDLAVLSRILQPDERKIQTKAIKSIRSSVTRIADYWPSPPPLRQFWDGFRAAVLRQEAQVMPYTLTEADRAAIETIKKHKYDTWEWNYGDAPSFNFENEARFPMGGLMVRLDIQQGVIAACRLYGDFLGVADIAPLENRICGCRYAYHAVSERIGDMDIYPYLRGISKEQLVQTMFFPA